MALTGWQWWVNKPIICTLVKNLKPPSFCRYNIHTIIVLLLFIIPTHFFSNVVLTARHLLVAECFISTVWYYILLLILLPALNLLLIRMMICASSQLTLWSSFTSHAPCFPKDVLNVCLFVFFLFLQLFANFLQTFCKLLAFCWLAKRSAWL